MQGRKAPASSVIAVAALFILFPTSAHAYIDPGILGGLYQLAYLVFFGLIVVLVMRPWQYLKSLFGWVFGRSPAAAERDEAQPSEDADEA